ncbi:hypothetical protein [Paenibacillus terrigena]|uniref:hypothetical protein n=1 Tax=Paenibacillus terrigena TaxID=369333 RepID=UPI00036A12D3|nr:hypothetical protein [Paenibacillus terrigena]
MRINLWMISVIELFAISGCRGQKTSFQADTFSDKDKCIVSIQNSKALCYGDSRADIEAIIQDGGDSGHPFVIYHSGVRVAYRGDVAVGFQLLEGSEDVYQTARGARVGMSKAEVMNLYGHKYAYEATPNNLDYAYDMKTGKFVEKTQVFSGAVQEKREQIFLVSAMFDGNQGGAASQIGLIDQKMAIFLE